ncbi:MAG: hypothetical protein ACLUNQ_00335 [Oscillospiraceae bacterium]
MDGHGDGLGPVWGGVRTHGGGVRSGVVEGAGAAVELCLSLAGALCLWSGFMELLKRCELDKKLAALFRPALRRMLPRASRDPETLAAVSGICRPTSWGWETPPRPWVFERPDAWLWGPRARPIMSCAAWWC